MKSLDRRWIFLAVGLVVFVFLKIPLKLKYTPSVQTKGVHQAIESLPENSIVFLAVDYGPAAEAELLPMHKALVRHMLIRNLRIIAGSVIDSGPPITEEVFEEIAGELEGLGIKKEYGIDYVNLGYKAGMDVAIAKIGSSIPETFPQDFRGTPIQKIPLIEGVINFEQISLLCSIASGMPGTRQWLQQIQSRYQVRMVAGVVAVMSPDLYSFFQSRQLEGFLSGLVGAAEYEYLTNHPGLAMAGMNVQSITHFLILAFIIFGNIQHFKQKKKTGNELKTTERGEKI